MKKYFGSKVPIFNMIFSKLLMFGFYGRIRYLKLKNRLINERINKTVKLVNDHSTIKDFNNFLNQGFTKINIGGGQYNLNGFVNIDFVSFPQVKNGIVANILDLSFIQDSCITHIYSNQVLEHLSEDELIDQFLQYKRILKVDGRISFRTPNTLGVCFGFWFGQCPEKDKELFVELGYPDDAFFYDSRDGWYFQDLFALVHWIYADVGNIKNQHLSIFTPTKMLNYLNKAGFEVLKMTEPETSQIIVVARVKK